MFEILLSPVFIRAFIAVILIAIVSALSGSFTVFRKGTFLVAGVAHAALAGAAFGIFVSLYYQIPFMDPLAGALIFAVLMAILVGYITLGSEAEKTDVAIGTAFAFSMSIAIIFISMIKEYATVAWGLIIGDILLLTTRDIIYLLIICAITILVTFIFFREFIFISFDPEGAAAYGVKVAIYHFLLLILISISVVVVLKGVGAILVYALLTIPPAIANEFSNSTYEVILWAFIISLLSGFAGLLISLFVEIAPSGLIGLIVTTIYILLLAFKRLEAK
ncbi:MAG: metal ABC transporter permease [Candidatus Asgardarchaeia archaeon]